MKKILSYFTKFEIALWLGSLVVILGSFFLLGGQKAYMPFTSLVGITALIFCAKGNPIGQALVIVFSLLYGIISFSFAYYGEMLTYLGMTVPMAIFALISWLKNPYKGNRAQVRVGRVSKKDHLRMWSLAVIVTTAFYFILTHFETANIIPSTISITTSFVAVYLTYCRSPYFALAYAANDVVLIVLWALASTEDFSYFSVVMCFTAFLFNDIYSFFNWQKMKKSQDGV